MAVAVGADREVLLSRPTAPGLRALDVGRRQVARATLSGAARRDSSVGLWPAARPTNWFSLNDRWARFSTRRRLHYCARIRLRSAETPEKSSTLRDRHGAIFDWAIISIWAAGFLLCTAFVLAKQIMCAILIRRSSIPVDERYVTALAELSQRLGVKRDVRLIVTSRPIGPAAFGLVRPSILMPSALLSGGPAGAGRTRLGP